MIEKITSIEEGVKKLLTIRRRVIPDFKLEPKRPGEYHDTLVWNGERIPLFDTHFDARLYCMEAYGKDADQNCALNVYSFTGSDVSLSELIYREFDIAELLLKSRVKKVTAFVNKNAANIIAVMENGTCANIDLGNTMAPGSENQCQHRLITRHGMSNDRGAGDMVVQHQISIYGQDSTAPTIYDDDEYYLYGLDADQVSKVLAIHDILIGKQPYDTWADDDKRYQAAVKAVFESDRLGETVCVGEI